MNASNPLSQKFDSPFEEAYTANVQGVASTPLVQMILEGMPDGILIVATTGKILQSNRLGLYLFQKLIDRPTAIDVVPKMIWRLCEALIDSRDTFADSQHNAYLIEEDITTRHSSKVRVRVRWLDEDNLDSRILIVLEDRFQTASNRAIAEGQLYGLTNRESEVWQHRSIGCSYKQISQKLFISVDTVKKHVKSIHAKREMFQILNGKSEG